MRSRNKLISFFRTNIGTSLILEHGSCGMEYRSQLYPDLRKFRSPEYKSNGQRVVSRTTKN